MNRAKSCFLIVATTLFLTACCISHSYSEATCTEPEICLQCGKTRGQPLGHKYVDATCVVAKKCTKCGQTEGSPLGHTVDVGECTRCNEYQGKDIVESVLNYVSSGNSKCNSAVNLISYGTATTYDGLYNDACTGVGKFQQACSDYQKAIELCSNYSELGLLKNRLQTVINKCPLNPIAATRNGMYSWSSDYSEMVYALENLDTESKSLANKISFSMNEAIE